MDWGAADMTFVAAVLAAIAFGSFVKGLTGIGLPLVAVPAIATISSVEEAVILMIIPGLGSNLSLVISHWQHENKLREHRNFLVSAFIGGILGTLLLINIDDRWLRLALATWLALYLLQYAFGNLLHRLFQARGPLALAFGLCAGVSQGATGISAQIIAPYFNSHNVKAAAYAFLVASAFLSASAAQLAASASSGILTGERLLLGIAALVPTLICTRLGILCAGKVSQSTFQKLLIAIFVIMEIKLLIDIFR